MRELLRDLCSDLGGRVLFGVVVVCLLTLGWIAVSIIRMELGLSALAKFHDTHECVRSGTYRRAGHFVGIIGRGGYWQPARDVWICYEWYPDDDEPSAFSW